MRVLQPNSLMDAAAGGPPRVVVKLIAHQVGAGHQVAVCITDRGAPPSKRIDEGAFAGPVRPLGAIALLSSDVPDHDRLTAPQLASSRIALVWPAQVVHV